MSYTTQRHNTTYSSLSPSRPELSAAGKVVFVTGGGTGIGKAVAFSFAAAGAKAIALLARREGDVTSAAKEIAAKYPAVKVLPFSADVSDAAAVKAAFVAVKDTTGSVDIVAHAAATVGTLAPLATTDIDLIWKAFEVNVKGTLNVVQALLAHGAANPVLVALTTGGVMMPPLPGMGSYISSKASVPKLLAYLAGENPALRVMIVSPGIVRTEGADTIESSGLKFPPEAYNDSKPINIHLYRENALNAGLC